MNKNKAIMESYLYSLRGEAKNEPRQQTIFLSEQSLPVATPATNPKASDSPSSSSGLYGLINALTGGQKWAGGISSSGQPTVIDAAETLQNARSASHQSAQAKVIIHRSRDITVDAGLKVEFTPAWGMLGITDDEFREKWTTEHEERFDLYMSSKQCHRSRVMTGYQLQRLWGMCDMRDNDQFGRFFYNRNRSLMSPVQIEFIDPTLIRGTAYIDTAGQQTWQDGILRNEQNQEIAYKVYNPKMVNGQKIWEQIEIPAKGARSGRIFMFHGYEPEYIGQGRGFSKLHPALQDFQSIVDFISATVKKAINQADMVGFVKPSADAPASNPMEDQQGGPPVPNFDDTAQVTDTGDEFCWYRSEYTKKTPGSDFFANLRPGEEIEFLKDTSPNAQFDAFLTSIFKYSSAMLGYPMEVVLMAFNSNYSASRAALLEAWRTGRISQANIKADLMDVWVEMWLAEEIAAGRTEAPGWQDPRLKQAWARYRIQGPTLPSISPRDDSAAWDPMLKFGISTQDKIARQVNGSDAKQNIIVNKKMFAESPQPFWEDAPEQATTETNSIGD
jgi:capsid protein